jgi:hypothetical protein
MFIDKNEKIPIGKKKDKKNLSQSN